MIYHFKKVGITNNNGNKDNRKENKMGILNDYYKTIPFSWYFWARFHLSLLATILSDLSPFILQK